MNEEFVDFSLAKKLKEKGFKQKCLAYYDVEDNVGLLYNTQYTDESFPCQYTDLLQCHNTGEAETQPDDSEDCVDAPTISQVSKWLREEKNISIEIYSTASGWGVEIYNAGNVLKDDYSGGSFLAEIEGGNNSGRFDIYEDAALAVIEYVLDNML